MSRIGFSANTQTLLLLALISNYPQFRDDVVQEAFLRTPDLRKNPEAVIRSYVQSALYPLVQDAVYGPLYTRLMAYYLDQVDFQLLDWTLRADQAAYFQKDCAPMTSKQAEVDVVLSNNETSIFWDAIVRNEHLARRLERLSSQWGRDVRRGARILRAYFQLHSPLFTQTRECPFIIRSLLGMSLERINWLEGAALLLDVPYISTQPPLQSEEREEHDPHVQLALLREIIGQVQHDFGGYVLDPWCSDALRGLCADLADECRQALQGTVQLEEQGHIFKE